MTWHPLLKRQLKKSVGLDAVFSPEIEHFFNPC